MGEGVQRFLSPPLILILDPLLVFGPEGGLQCSRVRKSTHDVEIRPVPSL